MDTHVLPLDDLFDHDEHRGCWCHPTVEEVWVGNSVVVHHSADGREILEDGELVVPPMIRH